MIFDLYLALYTNINQKKKIDIGINTKHKTINLLGKI